MGREIEQADDERYRPETHGGSTADRIVRPRLDPSRTSFEQTVAFVRYDGRFDPAPDSPEDLYINRTALRVQGEDEL